MKPDDASALEALRRAISSQQFQASLPDHQSLQAALAHLEKRLTPKPKATPPVPPAAAKRAR